jgi:hypothetical protein
MNQWVFNHHDLSTTPPRDIYNDNSYKHLSEVDYTICHDVSSEDGDQTNCLIYNFISKGCTVCKKGFIQDNFGSCQISMPVGCQTMGDFQIDLGLTLSNTWGSVNLDATDADHSRILANDLQLLSFYSGTNRSCDSCQFGWKQYHLFAENVNPA